MGCSSVKQAQSEHHQSPKSVDHYEQLILLNLAHGAGRRRATMRKNTHDGSAVVRTRSDPHGLGGAWAGTDPVRRSRTRQSAFEEEEEEAPMENILIFDWDDTLCPTSWAAKQPEFAADGEPCPTRTPECDERLKLLSSHVVKVLSEAQRLGKVVLVTNASREWVSSSCDVLLPEARALLSGIPVVYAMELISDVEKQKMAGNPLMYGAMFTESKTRAMRAVLSGSLQLSQSRANVVCIGDSQHECDAIRVATRGQADNKIAPVQFFTKTVKFIKRPSIENVTEQLSVLSKWLPNIVQHEGNVAINLAEPLQLLVARQTFGRKKGSTV